MTRWQARTRLHFGLLQIPQGNNSHWPGLDGETGLPLRQFGGVGLMIDDPAIVVRVQRSDTWQSQGPCAERALSFAQQFAKALPPDLASPFSIVVDQCPPEHTGLGVGTALGLSVSKAISLEIGLQLSSVELAQRIGRGERSAIGVHGFDCGGLIVEGGKLPGMCLSPRIAQHDFPTDWEVTLHTPSDSSAWFGQRERDAFRQLQKNSGPDSEEINRLCRLIVLGILPGIASGDLQTFGEAVYEYNSRVGEIFASVQGGRYSTPGITEKIASLRRSGIRCVGQSSWGPTIFAITAK